MALSRRAVLLAGGAMLTTAAGPENTARAATWLQAWDSQGTHRTATAGEGGSRRGAASGAPISARRWKARAKAVNTA